MIRRSSPNPIPRAGLASVWMSSALSRRRGGSGGSAPKSASPPESALGEAPRPPSEARRFVRSPRSARPGFCAAALCLGLSLSLAALEGAAQTPPPPIAPPQIAPESRALLDSPPQAEAADLQDRSAPRIAEGEALSPQGQAAAPAPAPSSVRPAEASPIFAPLLWLMRLLIGAGLVFGLGGVVFGALAPPLPRRAGQMCQDLMAAALVALPVSVSLEGAAALGRPLNDALFPEVWRAGLAASGSWTLVAASALAFGLAALGWRSQRPFLALAGLLTAATALASSALGAGDGPRWLTRSAAFLLALGAILGAGAAIPLAFHLRRRAEDSAAAAALALKGFLPVAALTAASGLGLAAVRLGWPGADWLKPGGLTLLGGLGLLLALLGGALWIRRLGSPAVLVRSRSGRRRLRGMLEAATVLMAGLLVLGAAWRFAAPAGTTAAPDGAGGFALGLLTGPEARAEVLATPERAGLLRLDLGLKTPDSEPLAAEAMRVALFLPGSGMEKVFYDAARGADGLWRVEDASLPRPGLWRLEAEARLEGPRTARLQGELEIER